MLQGRPYWGVSLPVPVGQVVGAAVTLVLVGSEQQVLDFARVVAESVASQGLLYGTLQAGQSIKERYDELCRAWDLVGSVNAGYPDPDHMALALVNKAKSFLGVQRASLGFVTRGKVKLAAVSEQDYIDRRTNLSRALVAAMKEAEEAERPILFPPEPDPAAPEGAEIADSLPAHATLADMAEDHFIATYPLRAQEKAGAVVVFERQDRQPFTESERRLQNLVCEQLGPPLSLARQNARGPLARSRDAAGAGLEALLGKGHVAAKLTVLILAGLVALGILGRWPLKVKGMAQLAPATRRAYAAPFDRAVLTEAMVLPGQIVKAGDPLFRFDDEELQLTLREARAKLNATQKRMDVAFSEQKVAEYKIAKAMCEELGAQIDLVERRVRQAMVRASFDGVVITGDLRQDIGKPFQMGQPLLEVAPLDELLLLVEVDQDDIAHIAVGQAGTFATKARPDVTLSYTVDKIRPVPEVRDQSGFFIVEARVKNTEGWLRPGMEAAASIRVGEGNITWVFFRKLVNWVRFKLFV